MAEPHFDLIVIGAGVLGAFHGFHAARAGKKVMILEKDQRPMQATVRNFGQVVPSGMSSEWFPPAVRGSEIYRELQKETDITARANGSIYIASDDDEQRLIHELKAIMDQRGYPAQLLNQRQCLRKWSALKPSYCKEGLYFPEELSVEPDQMIHRLLAYLPVKFPNLSFSPSTTVAGCDLSSNGVTVSSMDGRRFTASRVIVCCGGEFSLLFPGLFRESGIIVSKLQMMRTVPMKEVRLEGNVLTGLTIRRYESFAECPSFKNISTPDHLKELKDHGIHILFKKAPDGSFIVGDSHEYADIGNSDKLGFEIKQYMNDLMLAEASRIVNFNVRYVASTWAGFYPQHPHKGIVEIDIEDKIHIRTAIGGKGMTSAAGYAETSIRKIFDLP